MLFMVCVPKLAHGVDTFIYCHLVKCPTFFKEPWFRVGLYLFVTCTTRGMVTKIDLVLEKVAVKVIPIAAATDTQSTQPEIS